ncbi:MAG TPA: SGNH/GDSL hydrolase family protein [Actinopolymorphaceae bacterium]
MSAQTHAVTRRPGRSSGRRWFRIASAVLAVVVVTAIARSALVDGAPTAQAMPDPATAGIVSNAGWVGTWGAAPSDGLENPLEVESGHTLRQVVHVSSGGTAVRIWLSNRFNDRPQTFDHVTVAIQKGGPASPAAIRRTMRDVTFGGERTVTLAAGVERVSDPIVLRVRPDSNLLVTAYIEMVAGKVTMHRVAKQVGFRAETGRDHARQISGTAFTEKSWHWYYLAGIDVLAPQERGTLVAFGDSITDGNATTSNANRRWPDVLADRIRAELTPDARLGVVNAGISGNRLLLHGTSVRALDRVDADVFGRTNVRTMIVLLGINDIQKTPHETDPADLVAAYRSLVDRAHLRGIRVIGATITPFAGWRVHDEELEATRQAVNRFIRTSGVFDAVADFDVVVRDPDHPRRLRPTYDVGDGLHLNDAGCRAMAEAVDLATL